MRKLMIVLITSIIVLCPVIGQLLGSFAASGPITVPTNGMIDLTSSPAAGNKLSNGDFSNGFVGWDTYTTSGAKVVNPSNPSFASLDYSIYHTAAPSVKILADPNKVSMYGATDPSIWINPSVSIRGGEDIILQAWCYLVGSAGQPMGARIGVDFRDASNALITTSSTDVYRNYPPDSYVPWGTSGWVLDKMEVLAPSNAAYACLWLMNTPPQGPGIVYWDDAAVILVN
jgi:hypothetical protein